MKPSLKPFFLLILLALLAIVPASALAFRPALSEQLAQRVQLRALRVGDRGDQVAELQRLLTARGFDPGPVDGIYGPLTLQAVRAAQGQYGLETDGLAGRLTVGALQSEAPGLVAGPGAPSGGLIFYRADPPAAATAALTPALEEGPLAAALAADGAADLALTFNGLPDEPTLERVLAALQARAMQATFFISGEQAEARPDLLERIHKAGHELASLGYSDIDMRRLSGMTARALVRRAQRAIGEATGAVPAFFRPPQGRFDQELTRLVEGEGLTMVLWSNVAIRPVPTVEPARLVDELAGSLFAGAVLMLPMDRPNAVAAVEPLVERLAEEGYRSRTLSALVGAKLVSR